MNKNYVIATLVVFLQLSRFVQSAPAEAINIASRLEEWTNPANGNRPLPVKIYAPTTGDGPWPVVIVSHGLGGSREGLQYIGQYWAGHGYVSIHLQHVGSDESIWKNSAPAEKRQGFIDAANAEQFAKRCHDVKFALDKLEQLNADASWELHGKLDLKQIAMAGHSFGAVTTQAMCGQVFKVGGKEFTYFDPRIKVGIAFSPSPARGGSSKEAFAKVSIPMFHWTGTKDEVPLPMSPKPEQRRQPFDAMNNSDQYLVILDGGDHMIFNGRARANAKPNPNDEAWKDLIDRGSTAFLDAYLKDDAKAKAFLQEGEFARDMKEYGTFEKKVK